MHRLTRCLAKVGAPLERLDKSIAFVVGHEMKFLAWHFVKFKNPWEVAIYSCGVR